MKTSRLLLAAIPMGALVVGAVALGKWSFRNVFSPNGAHATERKSASAGATSDDRVTPIPGSAEEVARVADAMAQEGGPVLVTEVAAVSDHEVIVAETLLVPDAETPEARTGKA